MTHKSQTPFPNYKPQPTALSASTRSASRAFIVRVKDWPAANCIVMAKSAAKAKYRTWASAKEAGYEITFGMLNVQRLPAWDNGGLLAGRCYAEDYVNAL
jgi:hypothetical protein